MPLKVNLRLKQPFKQKISRKNWDTWILTAWKQRVGEERSPIFPSLDLSPKSIAYWYLKYYLQAHYASEYIKELLKTFDAEQVNYFFKRTRLLCFPPL